MKKTHSVRHILVHLLVPSKELLHTKGSYCTKTMMPSGIYFLGQFNHNLQFSANALDVHSFSRMNINGNIKYHDSRLNKGQTGDKGFCNIIITHCTQRYRDSLKTLHCSNVGLADERQGIMKES